MKSTEPITMNSEVVRKLRDYALKKHGRTHGKVKEEAENAILKHIGDESE